MAKNIVTLYIDDTSIRLLVTHDNRIRKWADLPLEPGLVKNSVVIKEAEVAAKIKQLFKDRKVNAKKVIVGLSGLHCLSRPITLPQLPKEMLDEAVRREAKRVLPVPLEQLYVSWQTIPAPEGKIHVFLVAVPCKTADALLKVLRQAGLKPYLMDIKPLLLARVVKEETAVIVDVQPTEFDIVIMAGGVPQPIRTVSLPSGALSWRKKLPMIRDELARTIEFYNSNEPEKPLAPSVPILASGELAGEPELCQSLSDKLGYPVLPLSSPQLKYPEGLDPNRYLVNIGLALKRLSLGKEAGPLFVNINALPTAYQPKPFSFARVFALPGTVITIGLLVSFVMLIQGASADIASTRVRLNATNQLLQQKLSQRQELAQSITGLQKKIDEAEVSCDNFTSALDSLDRRSNGINGNLQAAVTSLPDTISLNSINQDDIILTVSGRSPGEADVLSYLRNLNDSGNFSEITIPSLERSDSEGIDFTLALGSLEDQDEGVNGNSGITISSLPGNVSLSSISQSESIVTVNGWGPSEKDVLSYVSNLDASGKFSEIIITSMKRIEGEGMEFTLVLKVGGQG